MNNVGSCQELFYVNLNMCLIAQIKDLNFEIFKMNEIKDLI